MSIRHRHNSLFYKTERGAKVGDAYMSLIHSGLLKFAVDGEVIFELPRGRKNWQPYIA